MSVRMLRQSGDVLRIEAQQGGLFWVSTITAVVLGGVLWNKWAELDEASAVGMGLILAGLLAAAWYFSERRITLLDRGAGLAVIERRRLLSIARRQSYPLDKIAAVRREWGPSEATDPRIARPVLVIGSAGLIVVPLIPSYESRADDFADVVMEIETFLRESGNRLDLPS